MCWGWYPVDFDAAWNNFTGSRNRAALEDVINHKQPSIEDRMEYCSIEEAKIKYDTAWCEEYVYPPIPKNVLQHAGARSAWISPTPKPVEDVIAMITYCYRMIKTFGRMSTLLEPQDMDDDMVIYTMKILNDILDTEWRPWGRSAQFTAPPQFPEDLPIEQKRSVVAHIQKALRKARGDRKSI